ISAERVRDELLKIIQGPAPHDALRQMLELDLLSVTLPAIEALRNVQQTAPHHEPVLAHTLSVLQRLLQVENSLSEESDPLDEVGISLRETMRPYATSLREHLARSINGMLDGRAVLRLGALYHDVGKATTASVEEDGRIRFLGHDKEGAKIAARRMREMRLSNDAALHVRTIVEGHMRPLHLTQAFLDQNRVTRRAVYRFFRDTGDAGLDIVLLSLADHLATYDGPGPAQQWHALQAVVRRLFTHFFEQYNETVSPVPLLKGGELIAALHLKPGPEVGRLLRLIEEAQAVGEVKTKEEALAFARERLEIGN
ncbi:MAG: HDIG domain-containing metalloprotein, partial [Chloroflexota bacterium]